MRRDRLLEIFLRPPARIKVSVSDCRPEIPGLIGRNLPITPAMGHSQRKTYRQREALTFLERIRKTGCESNAGAFPKTMGFSLPNVGRAPAKRHRNIRHMHSVSAHIGLFIFCVRAALVNTFLPSRSV